MCPNEFFTIAVSVRLSGRFNVTQNKINFVKNCPQWGWKPGPPDLQASALPTELSQHSVASLNLHCLYTVMLYWSCSRNEQSPTCEVVHEANKAHFRNLLTNRFLPSSVGKALAWRSGGPGFNPHWGQFLTKFFLFCVTLNLSDNLTETPIVKNSKDTLSWYEEFTHEKLCQCCRLLFNVFHAFHFLKCISIVKWFHFQMKSIGKIFADSWEIIDIRYWVQKRHRKLRYSPFNKSNLWSMFDQMTKE